MDKNKILNIICGILYYFLGILGFSCLIIFSYLDGFIGYYSKFLFVICYVILPLLILFIPVIIKKYTKKEFYKSILLSIISVVVYFIVIILFETYYLEYSKNFTIKNWKENPSLRYLMIDNLNNKYNFINVDKENVIKVLGKENYKRNDNEICYFIKSEWLDSEYYCFYYNENNIIIDSYTIYID